MPSRIRYSRLLSVMSIVLILSFVLSACSTPAPAPATTAPVARATDCGPRRADQGPGTDASPGRGAHQGARADDGPRAHRGS